MKNKLTDNQLDALRQLSINNHAIDISTNTLNSLVKRGLIEPTGDWYYMLTDAGAEALKRDARK